MSLDPRLAAHAASFWGWSDDDDDQHTASATSRDSHSESSDVDHDQDDPASTLISHNHTIDDMRSDDDNDDNGDDDDAMSMGSDAHGDDDAGQDLDPGFPVKRTVSASVLAANRRTAATPQVVVFDDPMAKGTNTSAASYGAFKSFMSSKVSKVTAQPPPPPVMTDAEREEELELARQDRELDDLLKTSKLIEQVAAEDLTGRDRRKYQLYKLEELGMHKVKSKMPLPEYLHISDRDKKREARALQVATQAGLDVGSVKRGMTSAAALARNVMDKKASSFDKVISFAEFGKKKDGKKSGGDRRERGLKATNLGRFKDGMLVLSKQDIRKVQGGGVAKKGSTGGSRGGGGGKGTGKGKRK